MAAYAPIKGSDDENINVFAAARSKSSSRYSTQVNPVNTDDNDDVELALPSRSNHITSFSKSQPNPNIVAIENSKATSHSGDDNGGGGGGRNTSFVHRTNSTKQQQPQQKEGHQHQQQQQKKQQRRDGGRLVSLDVFRGLAVALMILVDDAGGLLPAINHSPWNGLTLADVVMPFFLFIVGVSLGLAYKKLSCKVVATRKAILRALKLLLLGLFLQGGYFHGLNDLSYGVNIEQMRWMGILQRIAAAYFVGAACEIWLKGDNHVRSEISFLRKYLFQWAVALGLIVTYLTSLYGLYVPDWRYQVPVDALSLAPKILQVKCDVRGDTSPACNAVGMIDRKILGIQHLYRKPIYARTKQCSMNSPDYGPMPPDAPSWCQAPFDPEGLLSSVMAIVTCLVGLHYGHIVLHFKDHKARIIRWMIPSTFLTVLGLALDFFGMRVNKALYSFSYMCVTAGAAGILFVGIYLLVDVCRYRRVTIVLEWMGNHALTIYVLAACNIIPVFLQGFYWKQPENNILRLIGIGR